MSKLLFHSRIAEAIRRRVRISLIYEGQLREVDPYIYGKTPSGDLILRAYQVLNFTVPDVPRGWRTFEVARIEDLHVSRIHFSPRRDYDPYDPLFKIHFAAVSFDRLLRA